uniref:Uncharacterized protein n=1 Tax=Hanusia phi TaxID=3032 RepID=A0A7S0HPE0_9CRYP|mmetsp:Transcript_34367/g.77447  ORF Transcript_34367/g.77447 Transcript_34367/m.77447 type:complete len:220 (+) Transcript_34367:27-686(+)
MLGSSRHTQAKWLAGVAAASCVIVVVSMVAVIAHQRSHRPTLVEVYPPYASKQMLTTAPWNIEQRTSSRRMQEMDKFWNQANERIARGEPTPVYARNSRIQSLAHGNWDVDLTSPRLKRAEEVKYNQQAYQRYENGESSVPWDPTSWHALYARGTRPNARKQLRAPMTQSLASGNWDIDLTSPRLRAAEEKQFERQNVQRYLNGEARVTWDPYTWQNPL